MPAGRGVLYRAGEPKAMKRSSPFFHLLLWSVCIVFIWRQVSFGYESVHNTALDKPFGVWSAACAKRAVQAHVLMNAGNFFSIFIIIRHLLASRAVWFISKGQGWTPFSFNHGLQVSGLGLFPVPPTVESVSQFCYLNTYNRNRSFTHDHRPTNSPDALALS